MIYVGGDVGWKPFFRFAHLTTILILLLYLLSHRSQRLALHAANVGLVFVLTSWLQAPSLVSQKTPYIREFALGYTIETSDSLRQARRWNEFGDRLWARLEDITADFPEDVLAATGKYLRAISDETETIITSAAGKIVYYSGLRSIDVMGLADVEWRHATFARRLELAQASSHLVFHSNDSFCDLEPFVDPHTELRPAAAFYSHTAYPGLYVIVFSKRDAPVDQPDEVGDRIRFTRHDANLGGDRIAFYTDRWDGPQEIEDLHAATGCLQ